MIGVQVRQQDVDVVGVDVPLQRAQHSPAEIQYQRRGVGSRQQVSGRGRIRADHTAGAAQDRHSHNSKLATGSV